MKFTFSKKLTFFSLSLLSISFYAQEMYIPYRDGNLWGISNYEGQEIIPPKFDSLAFNEQGDYDFDLIHSFKDHKRGIVLTGKEVLPAEFKNIYPTYKNYIIAEYGDDKKRKVIVDRSGALITEKPVLSMWIGERLDQDLIFHVLNENLKEDLFIWNNREHRISQFVFKDYYSISLREERNYYGQLAVTYRKNETDPLTELKMAIKDQQLVPYQSKNFNETIVKNVERNRTYSGGYQETIKGSGERYVTDSPSYTPPPPSRELGESRAEVKPVYIQETAGPIKKYPVHVNVSYSMENTLPSVIYSYSKDKQSTKRLKLPRGSKDIKVETFYGNNPQRQTADSTYVYRNYITFTHKNRKNILITEKKPTESDTIKILNPGSESQYKGIVFMLGTKNKKSGIMKYTLMNTNQQAIFPDEFDEVIINDPFLSNNYSNWTVKKDGKYGVISLNGKYILPPVYDEIINKKQKQGYSGFLQLKKDGKYGFLKPFGPYGKTEDYFVDPIFQYPVQNVIMNYPYWSKTFTREGKEKGTILVALEDGQGKLLGYANKTGQLYFKN